MSKAFDTLDHGIPLLKLVKYDFDPHAIFCFNSYLSSRKQYVKIDTAVSDETNIKLGVPQGSVLGPVLFILYLNDMPIVVKDVSRPSSFSTTIHCHADDTQIYTSGKLSDLPAVLHQIKEDTNIIIDWLTKNKLMANPTKFKYMLVGTPAILSKIPDNGKEIQIKGATLFLVSEAQNLGVTFDCVDDVRKLCNGRLIALSYLQNMRSEKTFASVVHDTA